MNNEQASIDHRSNREFWILLFCTLILFFPPIFLNETFYFRDLHMHFFPQKLRFVEFLRNGQFPLWDPYLHGGQPYLADPNNMALYPTNLLYLVLPPLFAFNIDIVLHFLLCAAGAYMLARSVGISPVGALVAGGLYAFCGYTLSLANLLNRLAAMPYLPFILLVFQRFLISRKFPWFILAAVLGALQVFAGAPEMTALTWITIFIWILAQKKPFAFFHFALLVLFIVGLSAIQLFPAIEMVRQSSRSTGANYATFSAWSLNPRRLPELFLPGFLGSTSATTGQGYWGFRLESMGFPFILSIYFGTIALLCAAVGSFRERWTRLFAVVIVLSLLLSFGSYLPGFHWIYETFHILTSARYPVKILAIALLPLSMLAAAGLDRIFAVEFHQKRTVALALWISAAILSGGYLFLTFSPKGSSAFLNLFFYSATGIAKKGVQSSLAHAASIAWLAALLYEYWLQRHANWNRHAFAILILIDLLWAGSAVNYYAPSDFFRSEPQLVKTVQDQLDGGRLYRAANTPGLRLRLPADNKVYLYRWNLETLQGYSATLYSIPMVYHEDFDDLAKPEIDRIADFLLRATWEKRIPFLNAAGVRLVISPDVIPAEQAKLLARITNASDMPLYLSKILTFDGLAFFPKRIEFVPSQEEIFRKMSENPFDPHLISYLQGNSQSAQCTSAVFQRLEQDASRWKYSIQSDCDTYVYFAQPFYNGWTTKVDGVPVTSFRANFAFTASPVKKGEHTVERVYSPRSFTYGWIASLGSLVLLVLFMLWTRTHLPR
jgi:hypothetical protein